MASNQPKNKFKIAHSLQQLEEELILTLKDQPLLKNNKEVNQDEDMLQNEQLQITNKMKHNAELRKKIKQISDVTTSHLLTKQQGKSNILPHYNDHSYQTQQIQVSEEGIINNRKSKPLKSTENDFLTQQQLKNFKLESEYNEIKIKKSVQNHLSSTKTYQTASLLNFLNETAEDGNLGESLKPNAEQAIQEAIESIRKKRITQFNAKRQAASVDISSIIGVNEQEELLNKAIANAKKKNNLNKNYVLDSIKEDQNEQILQTNNSPKTVQIELNPITYTGQEKKYIRKDFDVNGIKSGTTSAMFIKLPSERLAKKEQTEDMPNSFKDISPQDLQKMRQEVSFLEDKDLGTGLAGALKYLRQNSLLGQQEEIGRTKDKQSINNSNNSNDRVKLEYRNASGQLMKPKEAFRYLCATFHGQGPGKNKIQKRKKKELLELQMKEKINTDGKLLEMLNQHQKKTNQAFMVIDVGKKAASKPS